jgi:hypothetical protein
MGEAVCVTVCAGEQRGSSGASAMYALAALPVGFTRTVITRCGERHTSLACYAIVQHGEGTFAIRGDEDGTWPCTARTP